MLYDPVIKNGEYLYRPDLKYEFPVEIHFTRMETFDDENSFKVLVLSNESMMSPNRSTVDDVIRYHQRYDLILCADDYIITFCPNAILFPYGSTWLNRGKINHPDGLGCYEDDVEVFRNNNKKFGVSFLASWYRIDRPGYNLRRQLWQRQFDIKIPRSFYTSTKCFFPDARDAFPLPNGEKEPLFDSIYHVCIENHSVGHYFSEKIVDAFLSETMPIYWGCPNIEDYFNPEGIITFQTIDELVEKVNALTPEYYHDRLNIVHENKKRAIEFANFDDRIYKKVIEHYAQRSSANKT